MLREFFWMLIDRLNQHPIHSNPEAEGYAGPFWSKKELAQGLAPDYSKNSFRVGPAFSCDRHNQFVWPLDPWSRRVILQEIDELGIAWEDEIAMFYSMRAPNKIRIPSLEDYDRLVEHISTMNLTLEEVERRK